MDDNKYPPSMKCKCCGIEFTFPKTVHIRKRRAGYHRPNRTMMNSVKTHDVYKTKLRYCSPECQKTYGKAPDEFGLWWKE